MSSCMVRRHLDFFGVRGLPRHRSQLSVAFSCSPFSFFVPAWAEDVFGTLGMAPRWRLRVVLGGACSPPPRGRVERCRLYADEHVFRAEDFFGADAIGAYALAEGFCSRHTLYIYLFGHGGRSRLIP